MPTNTELTPEQIAELVELFERTSQGRWLRGGKHWGNRVITLDGKQFIADCGEHIMSERDADWITAAHNAMPALIEMLTDAQSTITAFEVRIASWRELLAEKEREVERLRKKVIDAEIHAADVVLLRKISEERFRTELQQANERTAKLEAAVLKTLNDNIHLADGDNCTLVDLKRVMPRWEAERDFDSGEPFVYAGEPDLPPNFGRD